MNVKFVSESGMYGKISQKNKGMQLKWEEGYSIKVEQRNREILISANREGLLSLANHLIALAQEEAKKGTHFHFDEYNSIEENSIDLIIEKI